MKPEILPHTVGLGSPQNARRNGMQRDLLEIPTYAHTIEQADQILGLPKLGSLNEELQTSGVTHTIAVHRALEAETGRSPKIWTAPSIGENVIAERTGAIPLDYLLKGLEIRQRVTDHPWAEGLKTMIAVSGADAEEFTRRLDETRAAFGDRVKAAISNINAPGELVISVSLPEGLAVPEFVRHLKDVCGQHFESFKATWLKRITNAFHSQEIALEQAIFAKELEQQLGTSFFSGPLADRDWFSPMKLNWIKTPEQVKDLFLHQLTPVVNFRQAVQRIMAENKITHVVSADPLGIVNGMFERNLVDYRGDKPIIMNVTDRVSFDLAANRLAAL